MPDTRPVPSTPAHTRPTTPPAAQAPRRPDSPDRPHITGSVGVAEVEASVLNRTGLPRVDYVDHFTLAPIAATSPTPTAEQWARALFGDVPSLAERFIWQVCLQLRLASGPSPFTVAGWRIAELGEDWIRLETDSWAMRAALVVQAGVESVSLTTAVQYDRAFGARVWRPLSAIHRWLIPSIFGPAAAQLAPGADQSGSRQSGPASQP